MSLTTSVAPLPRGAAAAVADGPSADGSSERAKAEIASMRTVVPVVAVFDMVVPFMVGARSESSEQIEALVQQSES
jgi:hypothetical protein